MNNKYKLGFLWLIIALLSSYTGSFAKLPFVGETELKDYIRNLDSETLQSAKPLEEYLDSVGAEPTDPILIKGIDLFNSGKIEDAIKYYSKIVYGGKKYTPKQREYADYQIFHIANFGILDSRYNGRPTKIDRDNGFKYGTCSTYYAAPSGLILAGLYPLTVENFWDMFEYSRIKNEDLDFLHSLLKAANYGNDLKEFNRDNGSCNININDFADFIERARPINEYMTTNRELPNLKILRKGIDLDMAGKHDEAFKYFIKLTHRYKYGEINYREYAKYQCWHIMNFGQTDPYYNGKPSDIKRPLRTNLSQVEFFFEWAKYKKYRKKYGLCRAPQIPYLTIKASMKPSMAVIEEYLKSGKYNWEKKIYDIDYLNTLISTVFSKENSYDEISSYFSLGEKIEIEDLRKFARCVSLEPLMSKMSIGEDNLLGIGLNQDQLFIEAAKLLPPLPDFKFDKGYEWKDGEKLNGKINNYLLRSAIKGNSMAMNAFIIYNLVNINSYNSNNSSNFTNFQRSKMLKQFITDIDCIRSLTKHQEIIDQYKNMVDEVYAYHQEAYEEERRERAAAEYAEKERKRQERAQFWGGLALTVLQGASDGLNIYAQNKHLKNNSTKNNLSGSNRSLAAQMSDPNYFSQQFNQLMATSLMQTQQKEMAEYQQVRQNYLAVGKDITLNEFRAMQGQAIMNLKNQGIDIIAEQNAANKKQREYNRSQMNSGKENVERIKKQNATKYGGSSSSSVSRTNKSTSSKSSTTSSSHKSSSGISSSTAKSNNSGTNNAYQYLQRKVNLHANPNFNSAVVFQNCEVYQKGSQYYVKIGDQYYQVQNCNKKYYNRTVTYGSTPFYFNM